MKKLLLVSLCFLMLSITQVFAQNRTFTGTVTAKEDGLPIPGVTVLVKGTKLGTQTNSNGQFNISAPTGSVLEFRFVGYVPRSLPGGTKMTISLETESNQLSEVVVTTALGIKRQAKELGYASTNLDNKTLTETHPDNVANGLTGKVAGLNITTYNNGINPTVGITLRGSRHIIGNNFALIVLNGVPISPDQLDDINPDDIASINVLNGSGAAALYGSEASNGALIVTTKHGTSSGAPVINYSNTYQLEKVSYFPDLQRGFGSGSSESSVSYGPSAEFPNLPNYSETYIDPSTNFHLIPVPFENQSYGPAFNGQTYQLGLPLADGQVQDLPYQSVGEDPRKAFFNTGHSEQNNVSYSSGDEKNNFFFSANNINKTDIIPNDSYSRKSFDASATKTYGIFNLVFNAAYTQSYTSTYGTSFDGTGLNDGTTLYALLLNTPAWVPLEKYKDESAPFADPSSYYNAYYGSPYWVVDNSRENTKSDVFKGSFQATITPTNWFDALYRLADSYGVARYQYTAEEVDFDALSEDNFTGDGVIGADDGPTGKIPGQLQNIIQYGDGTTNTGAGPQGYSRLQQDINLNFHRTFFNDFKTNLLLGSTIWQEDYSYLTNSSTDLLVKDFYNIGSVLGNPTTTQGQATIRQIGFYSALNLGYKDWAFLELTDRNDHDSRLVAANRSFFYPSAKGSFVFTDAIPALKDKNVLSYGKIRASISQVGDVNIAPYSTESVYAPAPGFPYNALGGLSQSTTLANPALKPEISTELELGADLGFFNNRINANITYYDSKTKDQTIPISVDPSTGFTRTSINVGEIQNTGTELTLSGQVLTRAENKVGLTLSGNLAIQNSKVLSLINGENSFFLAGYSTFAGSYAVVGKPFPQLEGTDINRDPSGRPIVSASTGDPSINSQNVDFGSLAPKYLLGLTQTVSYKFMTLTLTEDYRTSYVIFNEGESEATAAGTSGISARAGRQRFVFPNSVIQTGPNTFVPNTNITTDDGNLNFWDGSAYYDAASTYVSSGAYWKLREANLTFDLTSWASKAKFIKKASFSLVGRNLLMWRPKSNTWTDPEFSFDSDQGAGINNGSTLPPTRIYGANLNITF